MFSFFDITPFSNLSEDLSKLKIALANLIPASVFSIQAFRSCLLVEARIVISAPFAFSSVVFCCTFVAKKQRFGKLVDKIHGLSFSGVRVLAFLERTTVATCVFEIFEGVFGVFMGYSTIFSKNLAKLA